MTAAEKQTRIEELTQQLHDQINRVNRISSDLESYGAEIELDVRSRSRLSGEINSTYLHATVVRKIKSPERTNA
jgi:hypothetical protein